MPDIQILINQEVENLKLKGFKRISVSRFSQTIESNNDEIFLGNDIAIIEKVTFDARMMLSNDARVMMSITSPLSYQEEQLSNIDLLIGYVAKSKVNCWVHNDINHQSGATPYPAVTPFKIHLIRITPIKN